MIKVIIALSLFMIFTTGCAVRHGELKLDMPGVEVGMHDGNGHCPPGQAKKGNC